MVPNARTVIYSWEIVLERIFRWWQIEGLNIIVHDNVVLETVCVVTVICIYAEKILEHILATVHQRWNPWFISWHNTNCISSTCSWDLILISSTFSTVFRGSSRSLTVLNQPHSSESPFPLNSGTMRLLFQWSRIRTLCYDVITQVSQPFYLLDTYRIDHTRHNSWWTHITDHICYVCFRFGQLAIRYWCGRVVEFSVDWLTTCELE